jgi:hypothetical protein
MATKLKSSFLGWADNQSTASLTTYIRDIDEILKHGDIRGRKSRLVAEREYCVNEIECRVQQKKAKEIVKNLRKVHGNVMFGFIKAEFGNRL